MFLYVSGREDIKKKTLELEQIKTAIGNLHGQLVIKVNERKYEDYNLIKYVLILLVNWILFDR